MTMSLQIKPVVQQRSNCPYCKAVLRPTSTLWQGKRVCLKCHCTSCGADIIEELKVGHAVHHCYQLDLNKGVFWGDEDQFAVKCVAEPLLASFQNPKLEKIDLKKEVFKLCKRVIILNCIDHLYGHCLLKLLNAQRHLEESPEYGLIVIVPKFLRWMVPKGVAEVWTVNISLKKGEDYYPAFDEIINQELQRFDEVQVSRAYSHPSQFDISKFTGVEKHQFNQEDFKITFVWREDRVWTNFQLFRVLKKLGLIELALILQNWKVRRLFAQMRIRLHSAKFAVAGLGKRTQFPEWIEDFRVESFNEETEKLTCQVYADSRLVIGTHGSNMLLSSGHSGMTIDLMPAGSGERWGNLAQDILYHEPDPRLAAFRYRYVSVQITIAELARAASWMVLKFFEFKASMSTDKKLVGVEKQDQLHLEPENTVCTSSNCLEEI